MRYLKKFNERLSNEELDELKEFCNGCLVYLLDEGFELEYVKGIGDYCFIDLYGPIDNELNNKLYNWDEIKDYYIPFIQLLKNRYDLLDDVIHIKFNYNYSHVNYTLEDIMDDNPKKYGKTIHNENPHKIFSVSVKVSYKL